MPGGSICDRAYNIFRARTASAVQCARPTPPQKNPFKPHSQDLSPNSHPRSLCPLPLSAMTDPTATRTDKICDICGDSGYPKDIVACCQCNQSYEHIYCMKIQLDSFQKDWRCDECLVSDQILSRKRKDVEISCSNGKDSTNSVKNRSLLNYGGNFEQITVDEKLHVGTQKPLCTRDYSSKMPNSGKERSSTTLLDSGLPVRQLTSFSSKMVENGKVKLIPDEELLTAGVKERIPRKRHNSSANNQESVMHPPVSRRISSNLSLTASSKEIPFKQAGTTLSEVQHSFSKLTSEIAVGNKEENMQNCNASEKDAFGARCKREPLRESVGIKVYHPSSKNVTPTESKSSCAGPPLPNDEERKRVAIKPTESKSNCAGPPLPNDEERKRVTIKASALIKEEPMEYSNARIYDSPSNNIEPLESKSDVTTFSQPNEVVDKLEISNSIGNIVYSDAQFSKSGYQKKDLTSALLVVSDEKQPHLPVEEVLWKGEFEILGLVPDVYDGIQAHIPAKVSLKVYNMLSQLPEKIKFKALHRLDVWPRVFQTFPPAVNDIGLYFFPCELHRSTVNYIHLLELIDKSDLAMQSCIGDVELLVFTSKQLPKESQVAGLHMKMYLWGVFRHSKHHLKRKEQNLYGQEQFLSQTHVASMDGACCWPEIPLESKCDVKMEITNPASSRLHLAQESKSEIKKVPGRDIERINRPSVGLDIPPGFLEPFSRSTDSEMKPSAHRKATDTAISDIPPGFSEPYARRSGSRSFEGAAMGSNLSGKDIRQHLSPSSSAGFAVHDMSSKFHRASR